MQQLSFAILDTSGMALRSAQGAIEVRHRLPYSTEDSAAAVRPTIMPYIAGKVTEADDFEAFGEASNVSDPALVAKLRLQLLERGNRRDPADPNVSFRGRTPNANTLLCSHCLLQ